VYSAQVEKFKQNAFQLQQQLEFQRDSIEDPERRLQSVLKGEAFVCSFELRIFAFSFGSMMLIDQLLDRGRQTEIEDR
jgi:hypothetical protein